MTPKMVVCSKCGDLKTVTGLSSARRVAGGHRRKCDGAITFRVEEAK